MGKLRVLYVEDNLIDKEFLNLMYFSRHAGEVEAVFCETIQQAIARTEAVDIDVCLIDLHLPDSDGMDGAKRYMERFPLIPVVVISAATNVSEAREALQSGAHDFLVKGEFTHRAVERVIGHAYERGQFNKRLKEANEELQLLHGRAEAASRAKSQFLANVSHEIRTPLNAILGMAELLADSRLDETQKRYVEVFRRSGSHLLGLVNQMLDLSRIEAGELVLDVGAWSLPELVKEISDWARGACIQKDLGFDLQEELLPENRLWSDATLIRQILFNILGNAIKFTHRGGIKLEVSASVQRAGETTVVFQVKDTGIGIPADKLERIFDAFVQADSSVTRTYGGTGLGLAITRRLVEKLGGDIRVESRPEHGSCFRVLLRLEHAPAGLDRNEVREKDVGSLGPGPSARVLIAEDIEENRFVLQSYFRGSRISPEFAQNGREALRLLESQDFDLVLMDVQMPVMDGYSAVRELRGRENRRGRRRIPVIALTANAFSDELSKALEAGCDACLSKPLSKERLFRELARFVGVPHGKPSPKEERSL